MYMQHLESRRWPQVTVSYSGPRWLHSIHQSDMQEIQSYFDRKLVVPQTTTHQLRIGELRTCVKFGVADKLAVPV